MIVLAIAGLILAVVFIAVPALQRNQRNSARQGDRNLVLTQYDQARANAGGRVPSTIQLKVDEVNHIGKAGIASISANLTADHNVATDGVTYMTKPTFFNGEAVKFGTVANTQPSNQLVLIAGAKCSSTATPKVTQTAKDVVTADVTPTGVATSLAVFYMLEGDDATTYCQDDIN